MSLWNALPRQLRFSIVVVAGLLLTTLLLSPVWFIQPDTVLGKSVGTFVLFDEALMVAIIGGIVFGLWLSFVSSLKNALTGLALTAAGFVAAVLFTSTYTVGLVGGTMFGQQLIANIPLTAVWAFDALVIIVTAVVGPMSFSPFAQEDTSEQ